MEKSNKAVLWVFVTLGGILLVAGLTYAFMRPSDEQSKTTPDSRTTSESTEKTTTPEVPTTNASGVTIKFTDNGFDKTTYMVQKGATVTVTNNSSTDVEFSSADHPTHREEPELNLDVLQPGESGTFSVSKTGEFGFHDHLQDQYTGKLVVTE